MKPTLSAIINGKNFNAGGHKVGLGFELELNVVLSKASALSLEVKRNEPTMFWLKIL